VYESGATDPETIGGNTFEDYTIFYNTSPVSDITALTVTPFVSGVTVDSYVEYSWGAVVTVRNINASGRSFQLKAVGSTYEVVGKKTVTKLDQDSIDDNGEIAFRYPENRFLQVKALAQILADNNIASFKDAQRDLSLSFDVGGNPIIELGDSITVTDLYTSKVYKIVSQDISYNNRSISENMQGRV
jgi:hypothetical protein